LKVRCLACLQVVFQDNEGAKFIPQLNNDFVTIAARASRPQNNSASSIRGAG
jgi:hypothetical protein